ncbi:uncharacterized protein [Leptinotarsa decemlineata]|uniref:uncharacterized protein n=1 Tax=Leptinotarsa decemlineata TaxID=7539 RepID=UPI003D304D63
MHREPERDGIARICERTMAMEWSNEKVIAFLEILQTEPCLWDSKLKSFKNRGTQRDAWRRIMELVPFETTIEEMKKKKESLMGYYRTHLNKIIKSLKSGGEVYTTNWFAFETMDNFLRGVYEGGRTFNTQTHNDIEDLERSEGRNNGNKNSPHLPTGTEEASQTIQEENGIRPEGNTSQNYGKKRQVRDELPQEIKAARRQMDEAFQLMKEKKDDEYEMFGRLLAIKLKKIRNPNTRDILMNDIHNLVFRACMADRLEQQSAVPQFSTTLSPHHQAFSPLGDTS